VIEDALETERPAYLWALLEVEFELEVRPIRQQLVDVCVGDGGRVLVAVTFVRVFLADDGAVRFADDSGKDQFDVGSVASRRLGRPLDVG